MGELQKDLEWIAEGLRDDTATAVFEIRRALLHLRIACWYWQARSRKMMRQAWLRWRLRRYGRRLHRRYG